MAVKKERKPKTVQSTVCRVNKVSNFTIMSNYHLQSTNISLKAIGLLSKVLSLPKKWDYSIAGLVAICKEGETAVKSCLKELKEWGYLTVTKLLPNQTKSGRIEYVYDFYEYSEKDTSIKNNYAKPEFVVTSELPDDLETLAENYAKQEGEILPAEILEEESQTEEIQAAENQGQSNTNKKIINNKLLSDVKSTNLSIPEQTAEIVENSVESSTDGTMDGYTQNIEIYSEIIKDNIGYDEYAEFLEMFSTEENAVDELDSVVYMLSREICSPKKYGYICGDKYPREVIKSVLLKVNRACIERALDTMSRAGEIRNYERYFISVVYNEAIGRSFNANVEERQAQYDVKRDFGDEW